MSDPDEEVARRNAHGSPDPAAERSAAAEPGIGVVAGSSPAAPGGSNRVGIGAAAAKHPRAWLFSTLAVVLLVLGTGSVLAGVASAPPPASVVSHESTIEPSPFFAEDNVRNSAIPALDTVTTATFSCGDNLSNF